MGGRSESGFPPSRRGRRGMSRMGRLGVVALLGTGLLGLTSCVADPPPRSVTAVAGDGQATVAWEAPHSAPDGIAAYEVQPFIGGDPQPTVRFDSTATTQTVTGLANGTTYRFHVRVISTLGNDSAWSEASNLVTPYPPGNVTLGPPERPAVLDAPDTVTGLAPLVVLLHGYGATAAIQNTYLGVTAQAASRGTYVLLPNGTPGGWEESTALQFWNSGGLDPAIEVDDVTYLRDLIAEAVASRPIDPDRVYVFGHSNGGAMAYRLACELSGEVTAVAALASPMFTGYDCEPTHPVSVLSLHGDADEVAFYEGGSTLGNYGSQTFPQPLTPYLGAVEQIARWADWFGCDAQPVDGGRVNMMAGIAGDETAVTIHPGCPPGIDVQLDTIEGGTHVPALVQASVGTNILDWLLTHTG
jgi:polyhydroxybutyrate depolymerase